MTPTLRIACLSVFALAVAAGTSGCKNTCNSSGTCTSESTTQYTGNPSSISTGWASGQNIYVDIRGGTIRIGDMSTALKITQGSDPANIAVTFSPFISDTPENKAQATTELMSNLSLQAGPGAPDGRRFPLEDNIGAGVVVQVAQTGTHETSLSARVDLTLPANFDGAIYAHTDSGDIFISGTYNGHTNALVDAEGKIDITYGGGVASTTSGLRAKTANGDIIVSGTTGNVYAHSDLGNVEIDIGSPTVGSETGDILAAQGDITLKVPAASVIAVSSISGNQGAVSYSSLPSTWVPVASSTSTSATIVGNGGGNVWKLDASGFFTSNINVDVF